MKNLNLRILLLTSLVGVLAASCDKTSGKIESNKDGKQADRFLDLFPMISFNNLHIYSPFDNPDGNKFEGVKIDTTYHEYFSEDEWLYDAIQTGSNVFSCYKFALNDSITGLIVRIPSQYQESGIALCLWDNKNHAILKQIDLADAFGDGMWTFVQDGWITDVNNDGSFDIITRKMEWWEEETDETDVNSKTFGAEHSSDTVKVYEGRGNDFVLSDLTVDTTTFKVLNW